MSFDAGTTIMFAAILGLLAGIVWSLRYIVVLDKKIEKIDLKIERMLKHLLGETEKPKKRKK